MNVHILSRLPAIGAWTLTPFLPAPHSALLNLLLHGRFLFSSTQFIAEEMPQFTVLLQAGKGEPCFQQVGTRDNGHRISKSGRKLPCVKIYWRSAYGQKWKYFTDFVYEYLGNVQPTSGNWVRRNGNEYWFIERCQDKVPTPQVKRKFGEA